MAEEKRVRRDKQTVIQSKIQANNQKIADLQKKIDALNADNAALEDQLAAAAQAAKKAARAAEEKALLKLIKRSGKSVEEIKSFLETE